MNYPAPEREKSQPAFCSMLEAWGFDSYGNPDDRTKYPWNPEIQGYETPLFIVRPFYWGDCDGCCPIGKCRVDLWNFEMKDGTVKIDWYKYALREADSNRAFTVQEFQAWCAELAALAPKESE